MHEDRAIEALRDDLGVELEQLMAIAPAPELRVRVRERVARERITGWWPLRLRLACACALAVMLLATFVMPRVEETSAPPAIEPSMSAPAVAAVQRPAEEQSTAAAAPRAVATRAARVKRPVRRMPPVAPDYPVLVMPPIEPLKQISIEPVAIEPLGAIAPLLGEPQ